MEHILTNYDIDDTLLSFHYTTAINPKGRHYYAVAAGRRIGTFASWFDCNASVKEYSGCSFQKFKKNYKMRNCGSTIQTNKLL